MANNSNSKYSSLIKTGRLDIEAFRKLGVEKVVNINAIDSKISFQKNEDNEWLGFIYNGYKIKSKLVNKIPREINTKEDLNYYRKKNVI